MKNPHYLPNEKNGGIPPKAEDKRLENISVGCGWCIECRRANATNWRIRLTEEYKSNHNAEFVTLSFSPAAISELEEEIKRTNYKEIEGDELDVNILAAFAIRRWQERWRKKYKKSLRHWIVTELGHTNSERIHLHGIVWKTHEKISRENFRNEIVNTWKYGNVYIGQWVDERTINYITKYLTKIDAQHEGYKPRTFVSKGLGINYLKKGKYLNAWQGEKTNTQYKDSRGYQLTLPKYYKSKLYNEKEREELWKIQLDKEKVYLNGSEWDKQRSDEITYRQQFESALKSRRDTQKKAGYSSNEQKAYKYIVTDAMKRNYKHNNIAERQTQKVKRREIRESKANEEVETIGKNWGVKKQKLGIYIGSTTAGDRKRNEEITTAEEMGISVRTLRLIRKGVITM